jgi:hypothetical protein
MRKYIIIAIIASFGLVFLPATEGETIGPSDAYREAYSTYAEVTPFVYNRIYNSAFMDKSSRKVWRKAARDYCLNNVGGPNPHFLGPNSVMPFDCTGYGPTHG